MTVRDTSLAAYDAAELTKGQARILGFLRANTYRADWTRQEIAKLSGFPINVVCPRVLELIERGVLVELPTARPCRFTGSNAHPVRLAPTNEQLALEV